MVHHLTPKKAHIDGSIFVQNPYCWFILAHFWTSLTKPTTLPGDINIFLFQSTVGMSGIPDNHKKNFMIKQIYIFPQISYYMQKANFLPQIVFEILKFRKICNLIGLEYFQLQLKNYIFHSHEVFIDSHRWCINLKPKKSH